MPMAKTMQSGLDPYLDLFYRLHIVRAFCKSTGLIQLCGLSGSACMQLIAIW